MKTLEAGRYTKHRLMKVNRDEIKHDITAVREERKHWRQVGIQHRLMKVNRDEIKHDITAIREESTTKMKTLEAGWYTTHRLMKTRYHSC